MAYSTQQLIDMYNATNRVAWLYHAKNRIALDGNRSIPIPEAREKMLKLLRREGFVK